MKLALFLFTSALIATGCSTVQTKSQVNDPAEIARLEREKAGDDLHNQMLGLLGGQSLSASQKQAGAAFSAPASN